ncbi:MAG: hypothetical protein M3R44_06200 [Candidatus Eremiobacteraeota bacterium]|nr:hypothetical protein [Candidatus Eremiobacteraeota bacterium]
MIDSALAAALERIESRDVDARNAYRPGAFAQNADVALPAALHRAADPLSVALPEGTYVLTPDAQGKVGYSRDGAFHLEAGELQSADGRPVLGFALGDRTKLVRLRVDPYDAALGRLQEPRVDADGTLNYMRSAVDPRSGRQRSERVVVGRIALARFPAATQPLRLDATHVAPPPGVNATVGVPADGTFGALTTNARDAGPLDVLAGLAKMQEAYVRFAALRSAVHGRGETEKIAMDLLK